MNILEIAVYVAVLSGASESFTCTLEPGDKVTCTNGRTAVAAEAAAVQFDTGVTVSRGPRGEIIFSNGISVFYDAAHWLRFGNGTAVYRDGATRFRFNTGLICEVTEPKRAMCAQRP